MELVAAQIHCILYPSLYYMGFKWLHDNIGRSQVKGPDLAFRRIIRSDNNYGYARHKTAFSHLLHDLIAVFDRHDQVQQHGCHVFLILMKKKQSLFTVFCFQKIILAFKQASQDSAVYLHVIHNQKGITLFHPPIPSILLIASQTFPYFSFTAGYAANAPSILLLLS